MPRSQPHPLALFSLLPQNPRAKDVVAHPCNSHLVSTVRDSGATALDIGFNIRSKSCNTLAALGRSETDIFIEGSNIAKVQCSFEIDLDTNVVMLYDRSHGQTTQVFGENATPLEHGRIRKVVVQEKLNILIGMGGEGRNLIQFKLIWHPHTAQAIKKLKNREGIPRSHEENPRLARTVDDTETVLPSRLETRTHTIGHLQLKMRYVIREEETLSKICHPHIVDYIASQGWDKPKAEIFMGLKEGTLESLIEGGSCPRVADSVFYQMLQALDFLAWKGIVHRDVKPENILYVSQTSGQYHFQLGDFGLCNRVVDAATFAGSRLYMAPEMFRKGGQTSKLDVWSLFVIMLWTLDVGGFRQMSNQIESTEDAQEAVLFAASNQDSISKIQEMAIVKPEERASAAQMLVKYYNGVGLSTPRNQVPALTSSPPSKIATARAPAPAHPALTTRTAQRKPRAPNNANMFTAAAPFRVEKAQAQPIRRLQELRGKQPVKD